MKTYFVSCLKATGIDKVKKSLAVHFSELIEENITDWSVAQKQLELIKSRRSFAVHFSELRDENIN
jgi:hypothetical protein